MCLLETKWALFVSTIVILLCVAGMWTITMKTSVEIHEIDTRNAKGFERALLKELRELVRIQNRNCWFMCLIFALMAVTTTYNIYQDVTRRRRQNAASGMRKAQQ
jgi:uncharacterized membrane protein